jgi:hypothetical protein
MSDFEATMYTFIGLVAVGSYWAGHKKGVSNTVEYLEEQGVIEFEAGEE